MKSPRDILLAHHQAAAPKLDAIRESTLAAVCDRRTSKDSASERRPQAAVTDETWPVFLVSSLLGWANKLWLELVWSCRRIWAGLAVVWVGILIVNFSQSDHSPAMVIKSPFPEMILTFRDQQKLLNELLAEHSLPADVERPRIISPRPRTETMEQMTA